MSSLIWHITKLICAVLPIAFISNEFVDPILRNHTVPVGHISKIDLEKTFSLDFGVKCNFKKIRIEHVMLKFLATTENTKKIRS